MRHATPSHPRAHARQRARARTRLHAHACTRLRAQLLICLGAVTAHAAGCGGPGTPAAGPSPGGPAQPAQPEPEPAPAPIPTYDAAAFYSNVTVFGSSFSHDESRLLVTSDASGIFNVYAQPIAGGPPVALTTSTTDSVFGASYFPHDDRFLYSVDAGGNELDHVYVARPGQAPRDLTPGDKLKASFAGWSGDKKQFYIITNERDPKVFDLYRYAADGYARRLVFENKGGYSVGDISRDGRYVALTKTRTNADSDVYLVALTAKGAGKPVHITPHEGSAQHNVDGFSPDSRKLYYSTDAHGEFQQIWSYDVTTKNHQPEIEAGWDVMYVAFSETGRYRLSAINADARTELTILDTTTGKELVIPDLPAGDITGAAFSPSETQLTFSVSTDRTPRDLYVLDIAAGAHHKLTDTLNPAIDPAVLVDGQVVRYPSFDGRDIPAVLYRPVQASATARVPALVWVHGGPGGQSRLGYSPQIQHLVNHGYAVLAVNNRGSSGYGKTFFHLDDKNHGDGDLKDCVWGKKYLQAQDWVNGDKIGILGGSYGGFMTLAALAFQPQEFAVGVDVFGVANWVRTLESIPPWWGAFRDALYNEMGDPKTDGERLRRISPLFHAANIVRPLLVIQGANDPRVLKVESDEIVAAVKARGVPVEYVVFDDEGHGFLKKDNRIRAADATLAFLDAHLR